MIINENNFEFSMMCLQQGADQYKELGVDTETSGLNVRNGVDYLMGFCFSVEGFSCYMPFRHLEDNLPKRYLPAVENLLKTAPALIWHNQKFDMHSIKTIGIDPLEFKQPQYDTLLLAQLINEEAYSKELDYLARRYLKDEKVKDEIKEYGKLFGFANIPVAMYEKYGPKDAELTRRLKSVLWPIIVREGLESVYWETEQPFTRLLYKLEQRGLGVNTEFCERKSELGRGRMATIQRELGFDPGSSSALGSRLLDELELPVLAHTDSCQECKRGEPVGNHEGRASFNKRVMDDYDDILQASNNPTAKLISEYRGWQKAVTSLYEPMVEKVGPDGLIRTEFKQHGTVTGRLSSHNPNLQQIPRGSLKRWNGDAKSAFRAGNSDHIVYGWDYSQLELRLAAAYGMEALLLAEFEKDDADPFAVLAPLIFGVFTPETRHDTKTFVYANLYGAGLAKIASQLGRSLDETRQLYENYKSSISGIMDVSSKVARLVEQRGWVKYWDGRRRHISNKNDSYKAWNSVCQGGGAQLVKRAMLRCEEFETEDCFMVLQVHDEITFSVDPGKIDQYEPLIKEAMTDWPQFGVRLMVDGKEWK